MQKAGLVAAVVVVLGCSGGEDGGGMRSPTDPGGPSLTWSVTTMTGSQYTVRDEDLLFCDSVQGCQASLRVRWQTDCSFATLQRSSINELGFRRAAACSNPTPCGDCANTVLLDVQAQGRNEQASTTTADGIRYTRTSNGANEYLPFTQLQSLRPN